MNRAGSISRHRAFRPVLGAVLASLCGLLLWGPLGRWWQDTSYDYLFRLGARAVTNRVVLVAMDKPAYRELRQGREKPWDRRLHADLLDLLTEAGSPWVAFDVFFEEALDPATDQKLAAAMRRHGRVLLATDVANASHPGLAIGQVVPLHQPFREAATNQGIARVITDDETGAVVRKHYPFPAPDPSGFLSLPWEAARVSGAVLPMEPVKRWLRYYDPKAAWESISYHYALRKEPEFFRDKMVFVGPLPMDPSMTFLAENEDKVSVPRTRWTGEGAGGVEVLITQYLNLVNGDWLRRWPVPVEAALLLLVGILAGAGLSCLPRGVACGVAAMAAALVALVNLWWSHAGNHWFPWLVVVAGQLPCALAWAVWAPVPREAPSQRTQVIPLPPDRPEAPDYDFFGEPFGSGAFGRVWVVRDHVGHYLALKALYQAKFVGDEARVYDMEFEGVRRFKPISTQHPGFLRIDFVSRRQGYFYYVMELGDAVEEGWQADPRQYRPLDLHVAASRQPNHRLPVDRCVDIGVKLADALAFLHCQGFVHRDIKPANIIFVGGYPKVADVTLLRDIRLGSEPVTYAGTAGFQPRTEFLAKPQADIHALGKVLYEISTGRPARDFPALPTVLVAGEGWDAGFLRLNAIILRACDEDPRTGYPDAEALRLDLMVLQQELRGQGGSPPAPGHDAKPPD